MAFLEEVKRRKVTQVAAVYAVVAWLIVQIITAIESPLNLPDWSDTFVIVLVIIGFPLALVLAWAYDITPEGIVRTAERAAGDAAEAGTTETPGGVTKQPKRERLRNSVAVLPLDNLSPNPDDAYFAAGIHEEILSYLSKIKDLSVIARTSVKRYAGTDKPISEIADELGVETVMEGSVRYTGDRVRVTAQLIDAATQEHLWAEVYERKLADVFAIQADIASNIAEALEAEFSAAEKESIEAQPTTGSSEAHALYLKSQALFGQGDTAIAVTAPPSLRASIQSHLDRALELDPDFAHPYALKALLFAVSRIYDPVTQQDWPRRSAELDEAVQSNADKSLGLNVNLGLPYFALALNHQFNWRWAQARDDYERALQLRPNDANVLTWYSTLKWLTEDFDDAVRLAKKGAALDPGNAWARHILGVVLHVAGEHEASVAAFQSLSTSHPDSSLPYVHRALPEIALGHEASALQGLRLADELMPDEASPAIHVHLGYLYGRLGQPEDAKRIIDKVEATLGDRFVDPMVRVLAYLAIRDTARALERFAAAVERTEYRQEVFVRAFVKHNAWSDPILDRPEFVALRDRLRATERDSLV